MEQLRALLGPRKVDIGWDAVRRQVGSSLPPDFQDFAGAGATVEAQTRSSTASGLRQ